MSDKERVLKELEKRIRTGKALERVGGIYGEIALAYDEGSEKAVSELLKTKIASLKNTYDRTHAMLLEKMGL